MLEPALLMKKLIDVCALVAEELMLTVGKLDKLAEMGVMLSVMMVPKKVQKTNETNDTNKRNERKEIIGLGLPDAILAQQVQLS